MSRGPQHKIEKFLLEYEQTDCSNSCSQLQHKHSKNPSDKSKSYGFVTKTDDPRERQCICSPIFHVSCCRGVSWIACRWSCWKRLRLIREIPGRILWFSTTNSRFVRRRRSCRRYRRVSCIVWHRFNRRRISSLVWWWRVARGRGAIVVHGRLTGVWRLIPRWICRHSGFPGQLLSHDQEK